MSTMARMPYFDGFMPMSQTVYRLRRVIADCNKPTRLQKQDKLREKFFPGPAFARVMRAITERIIGFMRMQWEDIPQENG